MGGWYVVARPLRRRALEGRDGAPEDEGRQQQPEQDEGVAASHQTRACGSGGSPAASALATLRSAPAMPASRNAVADTVGKARKSKVAKAGKMTASDAASERARSRSWVGASGPRDHRNRTRTAA